MTIEPSDHPDLILQVPMPKEFRFDASVGEDSIMGSGENGEPYVVINLFQAGLKAFVVRGEPHTVLSVLRNALEAGEKRIAHEPSL